MRGELVATMGEDDEGEFDPTRQPRPFMLLFNNAGMSTAQHDPPRADGWRSIGDAAVSRGDAVPGTEESAIDP